MTEAPHSASWVTMARPRPRLPPVTQPASCKRFAQKVTRDEAEQVIPPSEGASIEYAADVEVSLVVLGLCSLCETLSEFGEGRAGGGDTKGAVWSGREWVLFTSAMCVSR